MIFELKTTNYEISQLGNKLCLMRLKDLARKYFDDKDAYFIAHKIQEIANKDYPITLTPYCKDALEIWDKTPRVSGWGFLRGAATTPSNAMVRHEKQECDCHFRKAQFSDYDEFFTQLFGNELEQSK